MGVLGVVRVVRVVGVLRVLRFVGGLRVVDASEAWEGFLGSWVLEVPALSYEKEPQRFWRRGVGGSGGFARFWLPKIAGLGRKN